MPFVTTDNDVIERIYIPEDSKEGFIDNSDNLLYLAWAELSRLRNRIENNGIYTIPAPVPSTAIRLREYVVAANSTFVFTNEVNNLIGMRKVIWTRPIEQTDLELLFITDVVSGTPQGVSVKHLAAANTIIDRGNDTAFDATNWRIENTSAFDYRFLIETVD